VLSTLRDDAGLPPPAVQAVLLAAMSYLNAELMNDLMTRRQSCSTSALKVPPTLTLLPLGVCIRCLRGLWVHGRTESDEGCVP
jgi:hypothetical protein